tara:strand:- start:1340 stop:2044 length:705 start_codon:yes stop_codon:yes gene_type:complete
MRKIPNYSVNENALVEVVKAYIRNNGFGSEKVPITASLSAETFRLHYYSKIELIEFCRSIGISTSGLKNQLNERVEEFLKTGQVSLKPVKKVTTKPDSVIGLSLDKIVVNYKSDPLTRAFFEKHILDFTGFSALVQKKIKQRLACAEKFTYRDAINMHKAFLRDKKEAKTSGIATKVAHDSCQYNQFLIDYRHDETVKIHSAKDAWQLVRDSEGDKTYKRYKDRISEIKAKLTA